MLSSVKTKPSEKAQIFSASKGDYYRTRMTHLQAVAQIARGIAEGLHLNLYLTEAIALAYDIGHTPFGHEHLIGTVLCFSCYDDKITLKKGGFDTHENNNN